MQEEMRKKIINNLINAGVVKTWSESVYEEREYDTSASENVNSDDMGIASDGTPYVKKVVFDYIRQEGLPFTQEYVDLTAKMFKDTNVVKGYSNTKKVLKHELEDVDDDTLLAYISSKMVELIAKQNEMLMEYDVVCIKDNYTGSAYIEGLKESIQKHSELGWRIKSIFTNEVGKNSHTVTVGGYSAGTNATIDQTIIIYERPLSTTDAFAREMYKELTDKKYKY